MEGVYIKRTNCLWCVAVKGFGLPIKGQDEIYLASELADAMVIG